MFCCQCEQTMLGSGCTGAAGVCGKLAGTADKQDELTGALIELAKLTEEHKAAEKKETDALIRESLFAAMTNVNFDDLSLDALTERVLKEARGISGGEAAPCPMGRIWDEAEDISSLTSLLLFGLRGTAAYACHAAALGYSDAEIDGFIRKALSKLGEERDPDILLRLVSELGRINMKCMALLERANTETYGNPFPASVSMRVEKGPFIVVSGHDLRDLKLLLEQTKGKGINVYTHGEMLPAHGYPELRRYPHLKGNIGTAWQNQRKEFHRLPAPILFTSNCLMPPRMSYLDNVFTTGPASFPGTEHIGEDKDFSPVIDRALALGGFKEDERFYGVNGGVTVRTGFGSETMLSFVDRIAHAVRCGAIGHIFLVGGCDGAKQERGCYTEFVMRTPPDTLILTLGCGKYRFNDLNLGTVVGLPRILDMGQCNDAYGAIRFALALSKALGRGVNDLPLTFVLSWYEQKAVAVLLTLFYLDIRNILLGPTLPAFISPNVLQILVDRYGIAPVTDPEEDLTGILNRGTAKDRADESVPAFACAAARIED